MDHREYERLRAELEEAYHESKQPEAPSGAAALNDLLVRIRLGKFVFPKQRADK